MPLSSHPSNGSNEICLGGKLRGINKTVSLRHLTTVLLHRKSSIKKEFGCHSSYGVIECNSSVYLKLEVIWSSPLSFNGPFKVCERGQSIQKWVPNLQTPQLSFTSFLLERESGVLKDSSVPPGSSEVLPKVTSTCPPCRVCPGLSLKVKSPSSPANWWVSHPTWQVPHHCGLSLRTTSLPHTLFPAPWAVLCAPTVPWFQCPRFIDISRLACPPSQLDSGSLEARNYVLPYQIQSCIPQQLAKLRAETQERLGEGR